MALKFYVYIHFRKDELTPFYIGKGCKGRITQTSNRNKHWHNIVNKHGFTSDVLKYFDVEALALDYEKEMINFFIKEGFSLANKTEGGEGTSGYTHTNPAKVAIAEAKLGILHPLFKGVITATCIENGNKLKMCGILDFIKHSFQRTNVYNCVNGKQVSHKGHTFERI